MNEAQSDDKSNTKKRLNSSSSIPKKRSTKKNKRHSEPGNASIIPPNSPHSSASSGASRVSSSSELQFKDTHINSIPSFNAGTSGASNSREWKFKNTHINPIPSFNAGTSGASNSIEWKFENTQASRASNSREWKFKNTHINSMQSSGTGASRASSSSELQFKNTHINPIPFSNAGTSEASNSREWKFENVYINPIQSSSSGASRATTSRTQNLVNSSFVENSQVSTQFMHTDNNHSDSGHSVFLDDSPFSFLFPDADNNHSDSGRSVFLGDSPFSFLFPDVDNNHYDSGCSVLLDDSQFLPQLTYTDSNYSGTDYALNEQETTRAENEVLNLKAVLTEMATTDLLKKLFRKSSGYVLDNCQIDRTNKEKFISEITSIIDIDSVELVKNNKLSVSTNTVNKYFNQFKKTMELILLPNKNVHTNAKKNKDDLILKLFIRAFAIKLVNVIREYSIPLIDMDDFTGEVYSEAVEKIWNYSQTVATKNDLFILFCYHSSSVSKIVSERFIINEIMNTAIGKNKSHQATWDDDSRLYMSIFPALEKFMKKYSDGSFESKYIKKQIKRRVPATHFRSLSLIDMYNYLVQENIITANTAINFFDSSIGWLDRLVAVLLCNKGNAFKSYVGFDPNPKVIAAGNQLVADLKPGYNPNFNAQLYQQDIETANSEEIIKNNGGYFSFAFTSPPYFFAKEHYASNGTNIYQTENDYKNQLLKPLLQINFNVLTAGGVFGLLFNNKTLLMETLQLVNNDIQNDSMKMKIWKQGIYYPMRGQKKASIPIYLFRRPNRIEEISSPLSFSGWAMQYQLIPGASSSVGSSLSENAVSAHNNLVNTSIGSIALEHSACQPSIIADYDEFFSEKDASELVLELEMVPQPNSSVSVSSSRNGFFSQSSSAQSSTDLVGQPGHTQVLR